VFLQSGRLAEGKKAKKQCTKGGEKVGDAVGLIGRKRSSRRKVKDREGRRGGGGEARGGGGGGTQAEGRTQMSAGREKVAKCKVLGVESGGGRKSLGWQN